MKEEEEKNRETKPRNLMLEKKEKKEKKKKTRPGFDYSLTMGLSNMCIYQNATITLFL